MAKWSLFLNNLFGGYRNEGSHTRIFFASIVVMWSHIKSLFKTGSILLVFKYAHSYVSSKTKTFFKSCCCMSTTTFANKLNFNMKLDIKFSIHYRDLLLFVFLLKNKCCFFNYINVYFQKYYKHLVYLVNSRWNIQYGAYRILNLFPKEILAYIANLNKLSNDKKFHETLNRNRKEFEIKHQPIITPPPQVMMCIWDNAYLVIL